MMPRVSLGSYVTAQMLQDLLAMVPQPVVAVILCYPITAESDAAQKAGVCSDLSLAYSCLSSSCLTPPQPLMPLHHSLQRTTGSRLRSSQSAKMCTT
jgi:hypothetical protein